MKISCLNEFNLTALVKGVLQSMEIMADQAGAKIMLHTEETSMRGQMSLK